MTDFISKAIHRIRGCLGVNSGSAEKTTREFNKLKKRVILEKKKDVRNLRQTNTTLQVLIEKGEFQVRIIKPKKQDA